MSEEGSETQAEEHEQQASLSSLEAGGLPLSAQRRLRELQAQQGAFTSDLSVADFALCHRLGLKPLSQVMGSCIYQIGYQPPAFRGLLGGVVLSELDTISQAWNEARDRALARLAQEATLLGAAAVVGIEVRSGTADIAEAGGYGAIDYAITGTAVWRDGHPKARPPVLSEMSVADYAKLLDAGVEPVGVVAWTSVFFVNWSYRLLSGSPLGGNVMENFELTDATQCFYEAREQVMSQIGAQARSLGAAGVVGVRMSHTVRAQTIGAGQESQRGLIASFSAIGTAVAEDGVARPKEPMTAIEMTS
jgi:uncharacterized protein YbjQ (UPF0145 family)